MTSRHGDGSNRSGWTPGKVVTAAVSAVALASLVAAMAVARPAPSAVDADGRASSVMEQTVSQKLVESYCPARMTLADASQYGDSAFRASEGDIASSSRYAAFGAVYASSLSTLSGDDRGELADADPTDASAVRVLSGDANDGSLLQTTQLLASEDGNGVASSTVSWASQGDLRGLAAVGCVSPAFSHSFLLPATQTGWAQQLVVANPSSKATSVTVQAWGTSSQGRIRLAVSGTVAVASRGESTVDLAAAAAGQDALYVTVSSNETPVDALVRVTAMNGLTPQGNDYVTAAAAASRTLAIPGVAGSIGARVLMYAEQGGHASVSWIGADGATNATAIDFEGQRVTVVDLGTPPAGATGVRIDADADVQAAVVASAGGGQGGQSDFAVIGAGAAATVSAVAVPDQTDGTLYAVNATGDQTVVTVDAFDASGRSIGSRELTVAGGAGVAVALSDLGAQTAAVRLTDASSAVVWNVSAHRSQLDAAQVAAVASLAPSALTPRSSLVRAVARPGVVG
ncbi:hypothetical protein G1C96_0115 [Bifidobacterium sp. DSM 109958]|uniref:Organic solvents resistance ABC transporter permease n=1 Tax=Bifidobacterium moraviense TaxID=2675323 RepID=A0A7Y0F0E7_9BIFI|nr:DUF5719 family protein [Bifidobacterium sp. DSM 109958]NMM99538.1 hypothetical protein [Bifidobacterium sp. DSM 109958]